MLDFPFGCVMNYNCFQFHKLIVWFLFAFPATRIQFFAIEIARNRGGFNDTVFNAKAKQQEKQSS